ncbi:MAG: ArsR family transcriptional regulator [Anaerolineae bacterium]|nr:ArsR family transcriptional regulator [Anaerolineae bacterium]MDH7474162.1 ArsR family transcriptional regulator [Anaerolineae bacterium]
MLEQLFSSSARVKVLSLLLLNADRRYYQRQIAELTALPVRAVQREMERLRGVGLVRQTLEGNRVYYQAEASHFLFPDLKCIFLKTIGMQSLLGQALRERPEIQLAFIYGSYAADSESGQSDIDLFVVGGIGSMELRARLRQVEEATGREVNVYLTTVEALSQSSANGFVRNVLDGPKIFLIGNEDVLRTLVTGGGHPAAPDQSG